MAVFKIIATRAGPQAHTAEFDIVVIAGKLVVGDVFFCFNPHHPIEFMISELRATPTHTRVICAGEIGFPNQYVGATVDNSATRRPFAFRYDK